MRENLTEKSAQLLVGLYVEIHHIRCTMREHIDHLAKRYRRPPRDPDAAANAEGEITAGTMAALADLAKTQPGSRVWISRKATRAALKDRLPEGITLCEDGMDIQNLVVLHDLEREAEGNPAGPAALAVRRLKFRPRQTGGRSNKKTATIFIPKSENRPASLARVIDCIAERIRRQAKKGVNADKAHIDLDLIPDCYPSLAAECPRLARQVLKYLGIIAAMPDRQAADKHFRWLIGNLAVPCTREWRWMLLSLGFRIRYADPEERAHYADLTGLPEQQADPATETVDASAPAIGEPTDGTSVG